jgi:hypothetical protein
MLLLAGGVALGSGLGALLVQQRPAPPAAAGGVVTGSAIAAAAPGRPQPPAPSVEETAARRALFARLRSPDAARLEDVRVWHFGQADERAVCGTIVSHEIPGNTARFVVRLVLPRGTDAGQPGQRPPLAIVEDGPGLVRPAPEAARRFCREAEPPGGAAPPRPPAVVLYGPGQTTEGDTGGPAAEGGGTPPPRPRVLVQSAANMRTGPGGAVLGVMPRGRVLQVFERAPGGWVQVGEADEPIGWIHGSLLGAASVAAAQP